MLHLQYDNIFTNMNPNRAPDIAKYSIHGPYENDLMMFLGVPAAFRCSTSFRPSCLKTCSTGPTDRGKLQTLHVDKAKILYIEYI